MYKQPFFKEKRTNYRYFQDTILLKEGPYMYIFLQSILRMTAWPMTPPVPYSAFHILLTVSGAGFAVSFARVFGKKIRSMTSPEPYFRHILFSCGVLLALMELYKQAFLYVIEFHGHFDWWYFPFQLCSIPMYICLAAPLLHSEKALRRAATFLQDFGLLGGIMALAVPPGLMHPYWTMTLHGFLWHFILLFLGLLSCMTGIAGHERRDYMDILPLFFLCCLIACVINIAAGPTADADMFYISPFHPSSQPVFHEIACTAGIFWGNLLYVTAMAIGGFTLHSILPVLYP